MSIDAKCRGLGSFLVCGWLLAALAGCDSKSEDSPAPVQPPKMAVKGPGAATPTQQKGDAPAAAPVTPEVRAHLHQLFKEATLPEPPGDHWLLDVTSAGKSVGKLYETVVA